MNGGTLKRNTLSKGSSLKFDMSKFAKEGRKKEDLVKSVKKPENKTEEDWIAQHILEFYEQINLLFSKIDNYCNEESCPNMSAGPKFEYFWQSNPKEKPYSLPAIDYIDNLMNWIEEMVSNPKKFPRQGAFPKNWKDAIASKIFQRLFRVFAHMFVHHFEHILKVDNLETEMQNSLGHFYFFAQEFNLIPAAHYEPLKDIIKSIEDDE